MREILFKAKCIDNGKWIEGYYVKSELLNGNGSEHSIIEYDKSGRTYNIIPETVGQYIGLTDNNGRKIFEGDILKVEYSDEKGDDCESQCIIKDMTDYMALWKLDTSHTIEVIGNIYDNCR